MSAVSLGVSADFVRRRNMLNLFIEVHRVVYPLVDTVWNIPKYI